MKKYKHSFYILLVGILLFSITIMWQNLLGADSKQLIIWG